MYGTKRMTIASCRALEIARAGEPDQPVPQILPLSEDEDHKDDDNPGGHKRMEQRRDDGCQRLQGTGVRLPDFHRNRLGGSRAIVDKGSARRRAAA
jgi:hypothetical protein